MATEQRSAGPRPVTVGDQYLAAILASLVDLTVEVRALRQVLEPRELPAVEVSETLEPVREAPIAAVAAEPSVERPAEEPASQAPARRSRRPRKGR